MSLRATAATLAVMAASGPAPAQQAACEGVAFGRMLDPGPQSFDIREIVPLDDGTEIVGIAFGPLEGEFAKVYLFFRFRGDCPVEAVSLGSYGYMVKTDPDGTVSRTWHLDHYTSGGHASLGFFDAPPDYATVRGTALQVLDPD